MTNRDRVMVANALLMVISAISLLKISSLSFPRTRLRMFSTATANVLVLMPPPVEFGEAPTHIKKITKRMLCT
nr:hypothetical protein [Sphingobacterium sp. 1.A.4]